MALQPLNLFDRLLSTARREQQRPDDERIARELMRLRARFDSETQRIIDLLVSGQITINQFETAMKARIRRHHLAAAVIAAGGIALADASIYALAQQQVDAQMVYFDNWVNELRGQAPTPEQARALANRARMYGSATKETAERSQSQALGLPTLPFYPANRTQCQVNCKCSWRITPLRGNGNYDCFWILGAAEHCPTCLARERACNPLKVRNGAIVDPERYQGVSLYA